MRKIYISTLFLMTGLSFSFAQCEMTDVPLSKRIQSSSAIFEGKVTDRISFWNPEHTHIYTSNTIEVYKVFKGSVSSNLVEIITEGGIVGESMEMVHPSLALYEGDMGTFLAQPASAINSPTNLSYNLKFETVASSEGFIKYDVIDQTASDVFNKYMDVQNQVYSAIANQTGASYKELKHFDMNETTANRNTTVAAVISNFTPTTITAGTQSVLTINGSGFGATKGTVSFPNADDGGTTYVNVNPNAITGWTDAQITVKVPSHQNCVAGTGKIRVTPSGGTATTSTATLTVTYSELTAFDGSNNENVLKLANLNGSGGYNVQYNTSFNSNTTAKAAFDRAMETWRCATFRNFVNSGTTATTCNVNDNAASPYTATQTNVVNFDGGCALGANLLGKTFSYYTACCTSSCLWILDGFDIIFSANAAGGVWNYGPAATTGSKYDFESTALHELAHATGEGHVINAPKLMHWNRQSAVDVRTLDASIDVACGNDVVTRSIVSNACGKTAHIKSTATCTTGMTEMQPDNSVSIYPNPFDNTATLHISNVNGNVSLAMYDVLGKEVKNIMNIKNENVLINRDNLPDGIYFYQVKNNDSTIATGKIVLANNK
jgi:hypothetical protein